MWFDVNWNIFATQMLPIKWRDAFSVLFVKAILKPLSDLYYNWHNWRLDNIYKIEHTGQICSLRGSLNDSFDPIERRIYIDDGQTEDTLYIFTEGEEQDVWLETESEAETLWLFTAGETADSELDFIVYVPEALYITQLDAIKAHIEFYRAAGKRYNIFIDE